MDTYIYRSRTDIGSTYPFNKPFYFLMNVRSEAIGQVIRTIQPFTPKQWKWIISGFSNSQQTVLSCWGEVIIHLILTNQFLEFDEFSEGKTFRKDSS